MPKPPKTQKDQKPPQDISVPAAVRDFLRSVSASVKLVALYAQGHPMVLSAIKDTQEHLSRLFEAAQTSELHLAVVEGRWLLQGEPVGDAALCESLAGALKTHSINSLTIVRGILSYEIAALCQLAGLPPSKAQDLAAKDFLRQHGIRHIHIENASYQKAKREAAAPSQSPIQQGASAPARQAPGASGGFGALIKGLVEGSVSDPAERGRIYTETIQMVKSALERRVSEATRAVESEKRQALSERDRVEGVVSASSEGRVVVDKDGRVLMMDAAAEQIVGKKLVDVAGKPILQAVDAGTQVASLSASSAPAKDGVPAVSTAGDEALLEAIRHSTAVVQDEKGRVVGTYGVVPYVKKLQEAVRLQDEFVSNITHDLKAPLASVYSALELINTMASSKLSDQERRFLDISQRNCLKLTQMINEILDFSKMQNGMMSVHPIQTSFTPIAREAVEGLSPWANNKGLKLEVRCAKDVSVMADHSRIVHVLGNLISNAIKYTPEGGSITVSCLPGAGEQQGQVVVSVADTGCGIDPDDQQRIFEKFTQASTNRGTRDGVGLGLTIAKQIVEQHGGKIWLKSQWGKGATFYFSLPAA